MHQATIFEKYLKEDPNKYGEFLRATSFKEHCGCYSCFEVTDDFVETKCTDLLIATLCCGIYAKEEMNSISSFYSEQRGLELYWFWDGDGSLVFRDKEKNIAYTTDCKKDYEWKFQSSGDWADTYWEASE